MVRVDGAAELCKSMKFYSSGRNKYAWQANFHIHSHLVVYGSHLSGLCCFQGQPLVDFWKAWYKNVHQALQPTSISFFWYFALPLVPQELDLDRNSSVDALSAVTKVITICPAANLRIHSLLEVILDTWLGLQRMPLSTNSGGSILMLKLKCTRVSSTCSLRILYS